MASGTDETDQLADPSIREISIASIVVNSEPPDPLPLDEATVVQVNNNDNTAALQQQEPQTVHAFVVVAQELRTHPPQEIRVSGGAHSRKQRRQRRQRQPPPRQPHVSSLTREDDEEDAMTVIELVPAVPISMREAETTSCRHRSIVMVGSWCNVHQLLCLILGGGLVGLVILVMNRMSAF